MTAVVAPAVGAAVEDCRKKQKKNTVFCGTSRQGNGFAWSTKHNLIVQYLIIPIVLMFPRVFSLKRASNAASDCHRNVTLRNHSNQVPLINFAVMQTIRIGYASPSTIDNI